MNNPVKSLAKDILNRIGVMQSKNVSTAVTNQKTFLQFKNCCHGQELVVCGSGPTLQKYRPIRGAKHIALNRSFLYNKVDFDFLFAQDWEGISMVSQKFKDYKSDSCVKLLGSPLNETPSKIKSIPEQFIIECKAHKFNTDGYIYGNGFDSKFVVDIESRPIGSMPNVGLSVMQFALYMNPAKLYIVGSDISGTHFVSVKQTKAQKAKQEKEYEKFWITERKRLLGKWQELKHFADCYYPGTEIISINPVGLRGVFKDWEQEPNE